MNLTGLGLLTTEDEDCSWSSEVAVTEAEAEAVAATAEALSAPILASLEERLPPAPPTESRDGGRASRKMESRRPREVVVESGSKGKSCFILSFKWKIRQ